VDPRARRRCGVGEERNCRFDLSGIVPVRSDIGRLVPWRMLERGIGGWHMVGCHCYHWAVRETVVRWDIFGEKRPLKVSGVDLQLHLEIIERQSRSSEVVGEK